ncbi:Gfo/Idh/MocA family oxidoreductase [Paralimibaculum aggregatum]|uniref:Gfo/Idh/MocA family oxidoreductase n=1 Tax=Paralimibaculum aggregatum TaxID=3036245 RepID=A0ABQ6LQ62_9RHOB|nr:Gfo/Idh/MocA family oxidoreductase [Limibaculum sp. NKW23]GMG83153.1 Gfo/Idh/MocA family oxidoreductase [Limibaculum sp. NKW23]
MTRLKVATVGAGFFSRYHYDGWVRIADAELVGLACARDRARAEAVARQHNVGKVFQDVEEMLEATRPDILDIITPPATHERFVEAALARGIHVICQKPLAPDLAAARRIAARAEAAAPRVVVHENWRFKPWFREIRRLLEAGEIGEVHGAAFRLRTGDGQGPRAYLDRQPYFQEMPRFLIHETGIHLIDCFRFLFGEIAAVSARLRRLNPAIAGEDAGIVLIDFASGAAGILDGNRLVDHEAENTRLTAGEMLVEGAHGQIRLLGSGDIEIRKPGARFRRHAYTWENRGYAGDCVHALQRHVTAHLLHGAPLENTVADYLPNLHVEEACYRSHASGRRVEIGEIAAEEKNHAQ